MHAPLLKLPRWHKQTLYTAFGILLISGIAWLLMHYGRDADSLPSPLEAWVMRLHGLSSMVMLMALGMVLGQHIPSGWRLSRMAGRPAQKRSGLWLSGALALAALTAYGLYYLVPESWHALTGWAHALLAAAALPLWWWHRPHRGGAHH